MVCSYNCFSLARRALLLSGHERDQKSYVCTRPKDSSQHEIRPVWGCICPSWASVKTGLNGKFEATEFHHAQGMHISFEPFLGFLLSDSYNMNYFPLCPALLVSDSYSMNYFPLFPPLLVSITNNTTLFCKASSLIFCVQIQPLQWLWAYWFWILNVLAAWSVPQNSPLLPPLSVSIALSLFKAIS